jgi:transposase InsO family protein
VSVRTLANWQESLAVPARPPGHPRHERALRCSVLRRCARAVRTLGPTTGWRTVHELFPELPVRLVQEGLRQWKRRQRGIERERRKALRTSTRVHYRDVLWAQDATQLGRDPRDERVVGEVIREVASTRTVAAAAGRPATGEDVVALLQCTARERGGLPLVWVTDNGPAYRSRVVADFLAVQGVVHLRNEPRTPQHNPFAERGMAELKDLSGLEAAVRVTLPAAVDRLQDARWRLDHLRPRASRGWKTAVQYDRDLAPWYHAVSRREFVDAARESVQDAVRDLEGARARRRATRQAIWNTLQLYGLVTRTRGGRPLPVVEGENHA